MELLIKLYSDKASRIGVKYTYEYQAVKAYEEIFRNKPGQIFSLKMELIKDYVDLTLVSVQTGEQVVYKRLEYKLEHVKRLQTLVKPGADLQFVHIFSKANALTIARPFRSNDFISLNNYEIVGPPSFDNGF